MRKGNKADYLTALCSLNTECNFPFFDNLAHSQLETVYVLDAMGSSNGFKTLGAKICRKLSDSYLQKLLNLKPTGCEIVRFVGDRYDIPDDVSRKCDERLRRDQSKFSPEYIPVDNLDIPDLNSKLKNPVNKAHLLHYLSITW